MKKFPKSISLFGIIFVLLVFSQSVVGAGPLGFDFAPEEFGQNTLDKYMLKTYININEYDKKSIFKNNKNQIVIGKEETNPKNIHVFGTKSLIITVDPKTSKIIGLKIKFFLPGGVSQTRLSDWHKYYGQEVISRYGNPTFQSKDEYGYPLSSFVEEGKYKYTITAYMINDKFEKIAQESYEKKLPFSEKTFTALKGVAVFFVDIEAI